MAILSLICLFSPFPLWLLEQILPYPHLLEELFKFFLVKFSPKKNNWLLPLIFGLLFSFSESILYLVNFFALGSFQNLIIRLILTSLLHIGLFFLLYSTRSFRFSSYLSLFLAIFIHFVYNQLVLQQNPIP